jgi:hypothetical protein
MVSVILEFPSFRLGCGQQSLELRGAAPPKPLKVPGLPEFVPRCLCNIDHPDTQDPAEVVVN